MCGRVDLKVIRQIYLKVRFKVNTPDIFEICQIYLNVIHVFKGNTFKGIMSDIFEDEV